MDQVAGDAGERDTAGGECVSSEPCADGRRRSIALVNGELSTDRPAGVQQEATQLSDGIRVRMADDLRHVSHPEVDCEPRIEVVRIYRGQPDVE
ncbi:hypothetical protein AB0B86_29735 [Micromonospora sp. NPDC049047]|uniref:hypothetical protein n=1 Tax=Micromonospora sp. NPDC049047 TaxID=3155645 RepID=UPI0033EA39E3